MVITGLLLLALILGFISWSQKSEAKKEYYRKNPKQTKTETLDELVSPMHHMKEVAEDIERRNKAKEYARKKQEEQQRIEEAKEELRKKGEESVESDEAQETEESTTEEMSEKEKRKRDNLRKDLE